MIFYSYFLRYFYNFIFTYNVSILGQTISTNLLCITPKIGLPENYKKHTNTALKSTKFYFKKLFLALQTYRTELF